MSTQPATILTPSQSVAELNLATPTLDRRGDVEAKQKVVAALLQELSCEALLLYEPENVSWFTSGMTERGVLHADEMTALYLTAEQRWLISSNVDTQRLFDEEIDGLGFQLKEWPWHWGRAQLLADLKQGKKIASDRPSYEEVSAVDSLRLKRRLLSAYEQACLLALGKILSHALEACCRTMKPNETEREIAGQLTHRLVHRGVLPVQVSVAADGRSHLYRQHGFTSTPIHRYAVLTATGRKYGLYATASRAIAFGEPDVTFRKMHDASCKVSATYLASTWPDAMPREILATGQRVYQITNYEHEWLLAPQGFVTGRAPIEQMLLPTTTELFQSGWAVSWRASVGAAISCDTYLVAEAGPQLVTPMESWPIKKIKVQGAEQVRPDILPR